jgi:threonine dehydratase
MSTDLKNVSPVYDIAIVSPLERASKLSTLLGCDIYLKREDLQPVHSFKLRGAYNTADQDGCCAFV